MLDGRGTHDECTCNQKTHKPFFEACTNPFGALTESWCAHKHSDEHMSQRTKHGDQTTYQSIYIEHTNNITYKPKSWKNLNRVMPTARTTSRTAHPCQFLHFCYTRLQSYIQSCSPVSQKSKEYNSLILEQHVLTILTISKVILIRI